ncbi:MAG: SCO family protein [Alphaproteobacteria bacterium]|nr:SCO family protein [Alphaproteobacteria bacterium]
MSASIIRSAIFVLLGLVALAAALIWRQAATPSFENASAPVRETGAALIGGPFTLTDHHGSSVSEAALKDHLTLVYFGYTSCPDVCPFELQNMGAALDLLAAGNPENIKGVQIFFITVDPARDTVAALSDYTANFHAHMTGLTGSAEQVAAAARAYRVYYGKIEDASGEQSYVMDHSNIIYLMGRDGKLLTYFGSGATPEQIAAKLREYKK